MLDVEITQVRCPRSAEHKSDKNVLLRKRPDGSVFCPVHGEVGPVYIHNCADCGRDLRSPFPPPKTKVYCASCGATRFLNVNPA